MEVYDSQSHNLVANITNKATSFVASGLPAGVGFDISLFATNSKGPSEASHLTAQSLNIAARRSGHCKFAFVFSISGYHNLFRGGYKTTTGNGASLLVF